MIGNSTISAKLSTLLSWAFMLVVTQLLITEWTINAAGNRDVIDYVSFAGTVVGMILAVLAIVYSYLSNASQKDDSVALRAQIDSLNDAIGRAQVSGGEFSVQLERLDEIRQAIALTATNSAATLEASGRLEGVLAEMRGSLQKPTDTAAEVVNDRVDESTALKFFANKALARQIIFYYLAVNEEESNFVSDKNELLPILLSEKEKNAYGQAWMDGEIRGYFWIFYDLGAVKEGDRRKIFLRALLERINNLKEASYERSSNPEGARAAIKLVKGKIQKDLA